jgi:hypothetical protein
MAIIALSIASLAVGLRAAWCWYLASKIGPVPAWLQAGLPEPADGEISHMAWVAALLESGQKSAELNKAAALWTAGAVVLGSATTIAGVWLH